MKKQYVTITGVRYYFGMTPFKVGKKLKCIKEPSNPYDSEAIKVVMKHIGTVGYIANSPNTKATGTIGAGGLNSKVKKKFYVKVMFITQSKIICKVIDGYKDNYVNKPTAIPQPKINLRTTVCLPEDEIKGE